MLAELAALLLSTATVDLTKVLVAAVATICLRELGATVRTWLIMQRPTLPMRGVDDAPGPPWAGTSQHIRRASGIDTVGE